MGFREFREPTGDDRLPAIETRVGERSVPHESKITKKLVNHSESKKLVSQSERVRNS